MKATITPPALLRNLLLVPMVILIVLATPKVNAQSNFITVSESGIDQAATYSQPIHNINNMVIYPRPTRDIVNVQAEVSLASNVDLTVMDMLGNKLIERTELLPVGPFNYKLDLSKFANGIYILEIRSGDEVVSTKLIKN